MPWPRIALIGVGLLGGSLGLAIKQRSLAGQVVGYVRRLESIQECLDRQVADRVTCDLAEAVAGSDLVILCTPLGQMRSLAQAMSPMLKRNAVVTDVGSVKAAVVHDLEPIIESAGAHFVGSHPMAGAEKTGVHAARPDLFDGAICALTPGPRARKESVQQLDQFWTALGARVLQITPELHDEFVGRGSHLPHIVAAELANYVLSPVHPPEQSLLCAGGFRDTTRIASGSPEMWRDIAMSNRKNLVRMLGVFIEDLQELRLAVERGDVAAVEEFFVLAKQRRDAWCLREGSAAST